VRNHQGNLKHDTVIPDNKTVPGFSRILPRILLDNKTVPGFSRENYTRTKMCGVLVDDDTIYTLLGLLIAEEHGAGFSTADVGIGLTEIPAECELLVAIRRGK
jgi:hypothetical protein